MTSPKVPFVPMVDCEECEWSPGDPLPKLKDLSAARSAEEVLRAVEAKYPDFAKKKYNSARLARDGKETEI